METFFKWLKNTNTSVTQAEEAEYSELKEIWDIAGDRDEIIIPDKPEQWKLIESRISNSSPQKKVRYLNFIMKIAAAFLILVASGTMLYFTMFKNTVYSSGQQTQIIQLKDGSEVTLNKNSELIVQAQFNGKNRDVKLNGEAYFKVTKGDHPFIISTSVAQIKVVGTEFNVKAITKTIELAVNEGAVDFSNINNIDDKVRVSAGYLSTCTANESPKQPANILFANYPGWIHGKFHFQNNTLAEICNELELNIGIKIEISVDSLNGKIVSGTLEDLNHDEIMLTLCALIQRDYKIDQGKYVIY